MAISFDLSEVQTTLPLIADKATVLLRCTNVLEDGGTGKPTVKFLFELAEPAPGKDGKTIEPGELGSKITVSIPCYTTKVDSKNPTWFLDRIARIVDALLGTDVNGNSKGKPARPAFENSLFPALLGKMLHAKFAVRTTDRGTEISEPSVFIYPGDVTQ